MLLIPVCQYVFQSEAKLPIFQTLPKSSEILRSNSCDLARPVAISSGALRTEASGRWRMRLWKATWRWSRCCWPRAPPSRRRTTTAAALRDRTDVTGRTWWEGGATGEMWKRCDTPLSLLPVLRNFQCTLRDSMLRSQLPVDSSCKFVLRVCHTVVRVVESSLGDILRV